MAKKYSSLQNLAKGSGTPYGGSDSTSKTSNPSTFNVPYLKEETHTFQERDGKSIRNYASSPAIAALPCGLGKYIMISSGEYRRGSFAVGSKAADSFRTGDKYPSAIYVNKHVVTAGAASIDTNYVSVVDVKDLGGTYVNSSGNTVAYSNMDNHVSILTGSDTDHDNLPAESIILVYPGRFLVPYAGIRKIRVFWTDKTVKDFDVIIPGWKNNTGLGESLTNWPSALSAQQLLVYSCGLGTRNVSTSLAHSHFLGNISKANTAFFTGSNSMMGISVTDLGVYHDNPGLWSEGFQPDDNLTGASSGNTLSHQETWPLGLFYHSPVTDMDWGKLSTGLVSPTPPSVNYLWDLQYTGSELTNITNPSPKRGTPLHADSEQHYKLIQGQLLTTAIDQTGRAWDSQNEHSQSNYASLPSQYLMTNTADDTGKSYRNIQDEMMSCVGDAWNNSSLTYGTHEGGSVDGLLGAPTNEKSTATFQAFQIYSKNLLCACSTPPSGGPTPLDLCNDPNTLNYWQFTGKDCNGTPIPTDLWNGSATLGSFGCTNCDYEITQTSCTSGCDCVGNSSVPVISTTEAAPTTLGGNDGVLNIEIATGGVGAFVYFIEPLGNTSAGLGVGAVEDYTQTAIGGTALTANGIWTYTYDSGSAAGTNLKVEVVVDNYNTSPIITLNKFIQRGSGYIGGEQNVFLTNVLGGTITVTINTVAGVVVSPYSLNNGKRHYEFTNQGCNTTAVQSGRKVTLGTNVYLEHTQSVGVNNYGLFFNSIGITNLAQFPPQSEPYKYPDFFKSTPYVDSNSSNTPLTGIEAGDYKITVFENNFPCNNGALLETFGCFAQKIITIPPGVNNNNGCTDNNDGTNDGVALNYDASATVDNGKCIYCRAVDGKLVDNTSTELSVSGSTNPGDILTSTNNSIAVASTDAQAADGSISYSRSLNSIMNHYAGLITNSNGTPNAEFKMELYSRSSSAQTLTGASLVGAPVTNTGSQGFNKDFDNISWSQGLTYGYYAIKSYVNDPQSASEQEDCFQVDYFIVPVLACIIGQAGMQVGITLDNETIADLDLVVASIPGNNLNPCTLQCCDAPDVTSYIVQTSTSCGTPAFNISQSCPNGIEQYITNTVHDIEFSSDNGVTWSNISSQSVSNFTSHSYTVNSYNAFGPGDYRVTVTRTFTWGNGTTSQCIDNSNSVSLVADICGCTDPNSLNFDPLAVVDDGSCTYCINGCMDQTSLNYNSLATCDDGSCMGCVYGCMDSSATNYNAFATCDDGSCIYGVGCGCTDILADNYGYDQSGNLVGFPPPCDDGSCEYGGVFCVNPPLIDSLVTGEATCLPACNYSFSYGCTDPLANNFDAIASFSFIDDGSCTYDIYGCTNVLAPNFDITATVDDGSCLSSNFGCTDSTAFNYDVFANVDDGSCIAIIYGCTDPLSLNYYPGANVPDPNNPCCYVSGCTDASSGNYNPLACIDDGSCCAALTYVPDNAFEQMLIAFGYDDVNDNYVCTANIATLTALDLHTGFMNTGFNAPYPDVYDFTGIEDFTALTYLDIRVNNANNSGQYGSGITTILDVSANTALTTFKCDANSLATVDVSNLTALERFEFSMNQLTSLDLSANTALTNIWGRYNQFTSLDVSASPNLSILNLAHNPLLVSLTLGSAINLNNLDLSTTFGASTLVIHVGTSARVTLAQSLSNFSVTPGTTFAI